jgi:hypothetical protein
VPIRAEASTGLRVPPARDRLRLVVSAMDHALNLETSTCRRTLTANGALTEVVRLDGMHGDLTDEELDNFVEGFPVERV